MTPVANPATPAEELYNERQTGTRVIVEQCFGVLKSRFRCLHSSGGSLQYTPIKCAKITIACLLLHNICVKRRIPLQDYRNEEPMVADHPPAAGQQRGRATDIRLALINQFSQ